MYKHYAFVVFGGVVAGCGITLESPAPPAAVDPPATVAAPIAPLRTVELSERDNPASRGCENLTRPGSRIVVAQRCLPVDEEALAEQLSQVRQEQDELDRLAREREAQRRGF